MKRHKARRAGRITLLLLLLLLACGILLPTALTVIGSFMSQKELTNAYGAVFSSLAQGTYVEGSASLVFFPQHMTFSQYRITLLQTPEYLQRFWNSVILVVPIIMGQLIVASTAAYSFCRCRGRLRDGIFFLYVILMLLPYQVTLLPNYLVAQWFNMLGTTRAIWFPNIFSPFAVFLLTRFMRRIPAAQLEAAMLDGADEWNIFRRVCLPQCHNILWTVGILSFADYWNMIEQPMVLLNDSSKYPLSVYLSGVNSEATGIAFAVATLYMILPLMIFFYAQKRFVAGFGGTMEEKEGKAGRSRWRQMMIPTVALLFLTGLGALTYWADDINPRFTAKVTLTNAFSGEVNGASYNLTLPTEAIHQDDYGTYVLTVKERKAYDGKKAWKAARVFVEILDTENDVAALAGNITSFDEVIETYTFLPEDNQYVQPILSLGDDSVS